MGKDGVWVALGRHSSWPFFRPDEMAEAVYNKGEQVQSAVAVIGGAPGCAGIAEPASIICQMRICLLHSQAPSGSSLCQRMNSWHEKA